MAKFLKIIAEERSLCLEEKENLNSLIAVSSSSQCLRNMDHCCKKICCCQGANICMLLYCPCGSLRSECRPLRLCGGPDPDPDIEALQPCRDRRCFHCFGPNCLTDGEEEYSQDEYSEDDFYEESSEDSGFDEMD